MAKQYSAANKDSIPVHLSQDQYDKAIKAAASYEWDEVEENKLECRKTGTKAEKKPFSKILWKNNAEPLLMTMEEAVIKAII